MQNKDNYNNKNIVKRKKKQKKTNKQIQPIKHLHRTDKALTGERERERERKKLLIYYIQNYKKTTLSNMQRKHHIH